MKKTLFLFITMVSLLVSLPAWGESAKIKFDDTMHDFGLISEEGGSVSHGFEFTNTGDVALVILDVTTNCGCTVADYPQAPIAPGGKGAITITFNPQGNPGEFAKEIVVKSNAGKRKIRLRIKGMVMPRQ